MSLSITQGKRPLTATTPLGETLVAVSLTGEEELSRPFLYTVDFVSTDEHVKPAAVLGKPMTLHLPVSEDRSRPVHGLVRRFTYLGTARDLTRYRAEVVPELWFLSLSSECRTFENLSALDVIEKICKTHGVTDFKRRLTAQPSPEPYIVQYRETDLAFISRLLEERGLYYTFEHSASKHTIIFSDSFGGSVPAGMVASLKIDPPVVAGQAEVDTVTAFTREFTVHSDAVALSDHDLLRADDVAKSSTTSVGARGVASDFLGDGGPKHSSIESRRLLEVQEAGHDVVHGESNCAAIQSGTRIKLTQGVLGASGAEFHVVRARVAVAVGDVLGGGRFTATVTNSFAAIDAARVYRPSRTTPRPMVHGTQLAKIVGSGGTGEIDVDADARVLLQFPWDRGDGSEGKSAHRVHVASVWSGTQWGFVQIPRIGQEVLVEYLEGDVSRPIVTGRVFNSAHKPSYDLPANKTQSGWKSRTLGGGSENFNELRFEDKKGEEHVFAQAEKDLKVNVKHDETRDIGNDRTTTIKNNDTRTLTEGDDTHTVSKGKQTITVQENQTVTVKNGNRSVTIETGNDDLAVKTGNLAIAVAKGNVTMKADLGKIAVEAMQEISLKVGQNSIVISQSGVTIKGVAVKIEAMAQAEIKGLTTKIEGQAMMQVKGPVTQVNGDGVLMLKGGVTMIN